MVAVALVVFLAYNVQALQLPTNRRDFVAGCTAATCLTLPLTSYGAIDDGDLAAQLDAKTLYWNGPSWPSARYATSSLQSNNQAPAADRPTFYPIWLDGYHAIKYKFDNASFPQGRKILSIRTAGAGLGSCLSLPNVGYNPSVYAIHFTRDDKQDAVYEDLAYNIPRRFEAFWPEAKVLAVQTNGNQSGNLGMKCLVTGEGCSLDVNPNLHLPSSRVAIDFDAPTRRSGRMTQSTDVTMLNCSTQSSSNTFIVSRSYSQYNINQDLQTFYKEIISLERLEDSIVGKIHVAAFLPRYIKDIDGTGAGDEYNENEAVAIYSYKIRLISIDEAEAANL